MRKKSDADAHKEIDARKNKNEQKKYAQAAIHVIKRMNEQEKMVRIF